MNAPTSLIEQSRFNMVEQQIRPANVLDPLVLDTLLKLPRERFVPARYQNLAFSDLEIPLEVNGIDTHETMLAPKTEARLAQDLQLKPDDSALEIGTGSGYQAALLSQLCSQVVSVEIDTHIAAFATENLQREKITNVKVEIGDGRAGWGSAEYNAILVTGSLPNIPDSLKYQLTIGGRLVAIVGQAPVMTAVRITRSSAASFETESLFETCIKPLRGTTVSHFKF
ncbi:MAG: protein-L-isoaspartate O-methyltransferase [Alcaligenaceae bacterium]|nr:protein-L-isoaspartate O-methyltransferase [Alcaligenaceae bacterium]